MWVVEHDSHLSVFVHFTRLTCFCFFCIFLHTVTERSLPPAQVMCLWLLKLMTSQVVKGRWMCTGSYGWFKCEKVKWRSKIKSVFNFSQYNLAPLRRNQRLQLLQILQQPIQKINTRNWWWHWKMGYKQYVWTDQQNTMQLH